MRFPSQHFVRTYHVHRTVTAVRDGKLPTALAVRTVLENTSIPVFSYG